VKCNVSFVIAKYLLMKQPLKLSDYKIILYARLCAMIVRVDWINLNNDLIHKKHKEMQQINAVTNSRKSRSRRIKKLQRLKKLIEVNTSISFFISLTNLFYSLSCIICFTRFASFSRAALFKIFFLKRILCGVTSTNSSSLIYSNASSNVKILGRFIVCV